MISYQVRDDPDIKGTLHSVRDLTPDETELQDPIPEPVFDPESSESPFPDRSHFLIELQNVYFMSK